MKSLADGLPPEIASQIHPDWRRNEADYWKHRDDLLADYEGVWVAFADGRVIAEGDRLVTVAHEGRESGLHPFVTCVGREEEPVRIRRATFDYDVHYAPEPLPVVRVEFRTSSGAPGVVLNRVIPDTGADSSALPWADCERLQLHPSDGAPASMSGVGTG